MRSWLTYIFLLMVACGTVLTSCSDVLSEEGLGTCDDRTTVRLTISFGGDDDPMSRDVGSDPAPEDDDLDYTTEEQAEIVAKDIYALVVDASGKFLYRIKDLTIKDGPATDGDYTRTLEGTMIQTTQQVKIVLLANLVQDGIITIGTDDDDNKTAVEAIIDGYEGQSITNLYNALIYNYNGTTPWTLTGENARRIPMWGESQPTTVPPTESIDLACYLYRALAKVQIWVNMKDGINGFEINSITVNNIHTKGYCVSQADADTNSPNYDFDNDNIVDGVRPYLAPWIPTNPGTQDITYGPNLNEKFAYSDMIYLPEKINKGVNNPVTITVNYTYNNIPYEGIIRFTEGGVEDQSKAFDIIRNHSYIFNITSVGSEFSLTCIVKEWEKETEEWDFTDNISESENLSWGSQGLNINSKTGEVIIPNTNEYNCTFGLLTPTGGTWQASLIPVGGVTDAFEFVGAHSGTIGESGTGTIKLAIKAKYATVINENNAAKLRIVVRTKDGRTLIANLTGSDKFSEYILVQNVNSSN